jgi:hypothetical protein
VNPKQFLIQALTRTEAPDNEALYQKLATVADNDYCLLAVRELLSRHLLVNAATAGSLQYDDKTKLRACERLEFARMFLAELELERANAHAWAKQNA